MPSSVGFIAPSHVNMNSAGSGAGLGLVLSLARVTSKYLVATITTALDVYFSLLARRSGKFRLNFGFNHRLLLGPRKLAEFVFWNSIATRSKPALGNSHSRVA